MDSSIEYRSNTSFDLKVFFPLSYFWSTKTAVPGLNNYNFVLIKKYTTTIVVIKSVIVNDS